MFVQPHFDDAALSVGGTIALEASRGRPPLILTVFGGEPDLASLTPFARQLHDGWGTGDGTIEARRAEDAAAIRLLGARTASLPFRDAIYRGDRYPSFPHLRGQVHPDDGAVRDEIVAALAALWEESGRPTIHVPLAIGGHVDHQLVRDAGEVLHARGVPVAFWEDFPHLTVAGDLDRALAASRVGPLAPSVVDVTPVIEIRIAAILAYASQIPTLFGSRSVFAGDPADMVRRFTASVLPGGHGERMWHPA